jgi:hypothetical protein
LKKIKIFLLHIVIASVLDNLPQTKKINFSRKENNSPRLRFNK